MNAYLISTGLAAALLLAACTQKPECGPLEGRWTNREGEDLLFMPNQQGLWLTRFGSSYDSVAFTYTLDCSKSPALLDLGNFQTGPYNGKTLFGIIEWSSDSSMRLRYEAGIHSEERPVRFDAESTEKYFRIN